MSKLTQIQITHVENGFVLTTRRTAPEPEPEEEAEQVNDFSAVPWNAPPGHLLPRGIGVRMQAMLPPTFMSTAFARAEAVLAMAQSLLPVLAPAPAQIDGPVRMGVGTAFDPRSQQTIYPEFAIEAFEHGYEVTVLTPDPAPDLHFPEPDAVEKAGFGDPLKFATFAFRELLRAGPFSRSRGATSRTYCYETPESVLGHLTQFAGLRTVQE